MEEELEDGFPPPPTMRQFWFPEIDTINSLERVYQLRVWTEI